MEVVSEKPTKYTAPEGYKRTEIGVVPEDWELLSLEELTVANGLIRGPFGGALKKEFFVNHGYKVYQQKNAIYRDNKLGNYFIDQDKFRELRRFEVHSDDFIVSCSGTIGEIYRIPKESPKGIINQALLIIRIDDRQADKEYFYQYFGWEEFQERITDSTQGGAMKNLIGMDEFRSTLIPLPPTLEEQQAIAEALSDVDALIAELDALIEKKQQVKKGAMQQLLTGKKRLPGFDGEWEEKTLEEIGNTYNGLSGKSGADFGDGNRSYIPFLNVMNNPVIDTSKFDTVKIKPGESQSTAEKGDLFFNTSSETPEEVGMCSVLLKEVDNLHLNSFCFGFRLFNEKEVVPLFLTYYFRSQYGREHMKSLAQGSTRYNLSKSKFIKIKVALPSYEEQKTIAGILSDMDTEIQALQAKRSKYKKVKQGMMQELLTGKTRLV